MSINERGIELDCLNENKKSHTKIYLNGYNNGKEIQEQIINRSYYLNNHDINKKYYRWDNLLHIEIVCFIGEFLLKEEFLWEKNRADVKAIKEFAISILLENEELNRTINLNYELIEFASEFITCKVLEEIKFYQNFNPYDNLKSILFEKGYGLLLKANLLNINIDINLNGYKYTDNFFWDIMNSENIPENFAEHLCYDIDLPKQHKNLISLSIRKQIKEYVFRIFRSLTLLYPNICLIKDNFYLDSLINDSHSLRSFLNGLKHSSNIINTTVNSDLNNSHISKQRKGKGGRYKNDFKKNFILKNNNTNYLKSENDENNNNSQLNENGDIGDNLDFKQELHFNKSKNKKQLQNVSSYYEEYKVNKEIINKINENDDFKILKKKRGRKKKNPDNNNLMNHLMESVNSNKNGNYSIKSGENGDNFFMICDVVNGKYEINENILFSDYEKIIISKKIFEELPDVFDIIVIDKRNLDLDVVKESA